MRILVTGGSGYLGSAAVPALRARGYEVVTIGRHPGADAACDLTDGGATLNAVHAVGDCEAVVHLAARAHDFRRLSLDDLLLANTTTTQNLIAALRSEGRIASVRFVHASSVSVYESLDMAEQLAAAQAPYAASKLRAEQLLLQEGFQSLSVLRFAPIYDKSNLKDVAKRVFLPGTGLKIRLCPPPMHCLCSLDCAVQAIVDALESSLTARGFISNVTDPRPIGQHELLDWFPGSSLSVPVSLLSALAGVSCLCGMNGRRVSQLIKKFSCSSSYPEPNWRETLSWRDVNAA